MHVAGLKCHAPTARIPFIDEGIGSVAPAPFEFGAYWQESSPLPSTSSLGGYVIEGDEVRAFDLNMRRLRVF